MNAWPIKCRVGRNFADICNACIVRVLFIRDVVSAWCALSRYNSLLKRRRFDALHTHTHTHTHAVHTHGPLDYARNVRKEREDFCSINVRCSRIIIVINAERKLGVFFFFLFSHARGGRNEFDQTGEFVVSMGITNTYDFTCVILHLRFEEGNLDRVFATLSAPDRNRNLTKWNGNAFSFPRAVPRLIFPARMNFHCANTQGE